MNFQLVAKSLLNIIPFLWAFVLVALHLSPERLWQNFHQSLPLVLIVIFYFGIFKSRRFNIFLIFVLGLITDFLSTTPFGLNTFIYTLMFLLADIISPYVCDFSFKHLWLVFMCVMLLIDIVLAWFGRIMTGFWVSSTFWFVQYLFMCLCYPIIVWITAKLNLFSRGL